MISAFILSQILIGIAFLFDLASFQFKKREITLFLFFCAASLISAHFFLLEEKTAGFIVAISALRFLVSVFTTHKKLKYFFLTIIVVAALGTFNGVEDIFSLAAGVLGTFAAFHRNERMLRIIMAFGTLAIITHNIIIWTPAGIALEVVFLGSNIVSYYRFYLKKS